MEPEKQYRIEMFRTRFAESEVFLVNEAAAKKVAQDLEVGAPFLTFTDCDGKFWAIPTRTIDDAVSIEEAGQTDVEPAVVT